MYAYVCLCMKPEVDDGCLPQTLSILHIEAASLREPGVHGFSQSSWLACSGALCLCLLRVGITDRVPRSPNIYMGAREPPQQPRPSLSSCWDLF